MYDARLNLSRQVAADAREYFGAQVFETVVPRNVRLAEAPSFGKPIILYDVSSHRGAGLHGRSPSELMAPAPRRGGVRPTPAAGSAAIRGRGAAPARRMSAPTRRPAGSAAGSRRCSRRRQQSSSPPARSRVARCRACRSAEIRPNPFQPPQEFRAEELADLEASLKATGCCSPSPCAERRTGDGYELIAGERRFRAASRLGWTEIPAVVQGHRRPDAAHARPRREPAARRPQSARRGRRLPAAGRRVRADAAAGRRGRREGPDDGHQLLAAADAAGRPYGDGAGGRTHRGPRARAAAAGRRARDRRAGPGDRRARASACARSSGASARAAAGQPRASTPRRAARQARPDAEVRRIEDQLRRHFQTDVAISLSEAANGRVRIAFYSTDDLDRVLDLLGTRPD